MCVCVHIYVCVCVCVRRRFIHLSCAMNPVSTLVSNAATKCCFMLPSFRELLRNRSAEIYTIHMMIILVRIIIGVEERKKERKKERLCTHFAPVTVVLVEPAHFSSVLPSLNISAIVVCMRERPNSKVCINFEPAK